MNFKPYPFLRYLLFLIPGIVLNEYCSTQPEFLLTALLLFSLVYIAGIIYRKRYLRYMLFPMLFILGCWMAVVHNERTSPAHFLNQGDYSSYLVSINSATEPKPKTYKCTAEIKAIRTGNKWKKVKGKTLLYFTKSSNSIPSFGDVYIIRGKPREIEPPKNAFEFDYRQYQRRKNVYTHHFLRTGDFARAGHKTIHPLFEWAQSLNRYSDQSFRKHMETPDQLGVAEALIAGIRSELDQDIVNAYSVSGAIHVLSVSGMHVGILFLVLNWMAGFLNKEKNKKLIPTIILIGLLWIYALYTGLSPSVCRATLMFSLIQIGQALNRDANSYNIIAFSAFVLLLINPNWLFDVGFQLSYLAVLGIIMLYNPIRNQLEIKNRALRWLWEISVVSFVAQLFTFPLSIYYFHQFPTYFLLSNPAVAILATPILPVGLLLIVFAKVPFLADALGMALKYLIQWLNDFVIFTTSLPFSSLKGFSMTLPGLALLYLFIGSLTYFFLKSDIRALKLASVSMAVLCMMKIFGFYRQASQHEMAFHYIPNSSAVSIIDGREAKTIAADSVLNDPMVYQFHLKNYYDHAGIHKTEKIPVPDVGANQISDGKHAVVWIHKRIKWTPVPAQIVLISNNAVKDLKDFKEFSFRGKIILDGSNKKWVVEKLKNQARAYKMDLISLYDHGSLIISGRE